MRTGYSSFKGFGVLLGIVRSCSNASICVQHMGNWSYLLYLVLTNPQMPPATKSKAMGMG